MEKLQFIEPRHHSWQRNEVRYSTVKEHKETNGPLLNTECTSSVHTSDKHDDANRKTSDTDNQNERQL